MTSDHETIGKIIPEEDVEKIATEALAGTFKKASEYLLHDFYDVCQSYLSEHFSNLEDKIWREVSNQIMRGYSEGKWSKYNHKELRETLLKENKEQIIKDLNQDLVEENEKLKKDLQWEKECRSRMRY